MENLEGYKNYIANIKEYELYFIIDECGVLLQNIQNAFAAGLIAEEDAEKSILGMTEISEMQQVAVDETVRFQVNSSVIEIKDEETGKIKREINAEYWKWYDHWDNWKAQLNEEQWDIVQERISKNESIDDLLPTTRWYEA